MGDLTARQAEVAKRIACGLTTKEVAKELRISQHTVEFHIRAAAERLPGDGWPRHRLTLWFLSIADDE